MTTKKTSKTRDAVTILKNRYFKDDPTIDARLEQGVEELKIAQQIYELRTAAGLTQRELADRIGTTQTVISRLESADYEGHSFSMLRRIAKALDQGIEIRFYPLKKRAVGSE